MGLLTSYEDHDTYDEPSRDAVRPRGAVAGQRGARPCRWGWINNSELDTEYAVIKHLGLSKRDEVT